MHGRACPSSPPRRRSRAFSARFLRLGVRVALLLAGLALPCDVVRADGGFVWRTRDADIREPEQKALLIHDAGMEDLVLEVRYAGASEDFGWIVPLPVAPVMSPDQADLFSDLSRWTQWSPYGRAAARPGWLHLRTATSVTQGLGGVDVLDRERVGIFDATVIASRDERALRGWLARHRFSLRRGGESVLAGYVRRGWVLACLRVSPDEQDPMLERSLATGVIQPVRFHFPSPDPVYPLAISALNGDTSEVLLYTLARRPLVLAAGDAAGWDQHVFGPFDWTSERTSFCGLDGGRGVLTKLRAKLAPSRMRDLVLRPFDPLAGLRSADAGLRAEAATDIGWHATPGGAEALVRLLADHRQGPDALSAIWALGRLGDRAGVPTLLSCAASRNPETRREAMEALAQARAPEALPIFLDGLRWGEPAESDSTLEVWRSCLDHLVELGDSTCIPELRARMAAAPLPGDAAREGWTFTEMMLAVRAACGDAEARVAIRDSLVHVSPQECDLALIRDVAQEGCLSLAEQRWDPMALSAFGLIQNQPWRALAIEGWLLRGRPAARDAILRAAAGDPRLPDAGKVVLLRGLSRAEPADLEVLWTIWTRSTTVDSATAAASTRVRFPDLKYGRTTPYRLIPCAVAYALARHHDAAGLLRLWETRPARDATLEQELVWAMAASGSGLVLDTLLAYVGRSWQPSGPDGTYGISLVPGPGRPRGGSLYEWQSGGPDLPCRRQAILHLVTRAARDTAVLRRLVTDPATHPALRMLWIANTPWNEADCRPLLPVALAALDSIARESATHPSVSELARDMREVLGASPRARGDEEPAGRRRF